MIFALSFLDYSASFGGGSQWLGDDLSFTLSVHSVECVCGWT